MESIEFDVEVDIKLSEAETLSSGYRWGGEGEFDGIDIAIHPPKGHGFGLTELLTISVTVATTVTTDLLAGAIKEAVRGTVRRVRLRNSVTETHIADDESLDDFDLRSTTLSTAVEEALAIDDSVEHEHEDHDDS